MAVALVARNAVLPSSRAQDDPHGHCVADAECRLNNRQFADVVDGMASLLAGRGVRSGDTVGVLLPNCVELVVTLFASWRLGAVVTPVDPALAREQVIHQLQDAGAVVLVAADDQRTTATKADADFIPRSCVLRTTPMPELGPVTTAPNDFALVMYQRTAPQPLRGVLLDHSNLASMSDAIIDRLALSSSDSSQVVLPLWACEGMLLGMLAALGAGGGVVVAAGVERADLWCRTAPCETTFFCASPEVYQTLLADPAVSVVGGTPSLRFAVCAPGPLPRELRQRFEQRFGVPVVEGWCAPEATAAVTLNPSKSRRKPGTVGLPMLGHDVRAVAAQGEFLPAGVVGEIVVRGRSVMRGYLGRPDATAEMLRGEWLRTGAAGYLDEDGYLVLVDRVADVLLRGQRHVYPREVEAVLQTHDAVAEAVVIRRTEPVLGEVPVAYVVLRPGKTVTADDLIVHCQEFLDGYKVPEDVYVVAALPRDASGAVATSALSSAEARGAFAV
jgi:long-chain acyl-CoA synthetase